MKTAFILFALVSLTLTGCIIPYRYIVAPPVSGVVVDTQSGSPISGALIVVRSKDDSGIFHRTHETRTDEQGRFSIPVQKVTWIYIIPQEPYYPAATLKVYAEGYEAYTESDLGSPLSERLRVAKTANPRLAYGDFSYLDNLIVKLRKKEPNQPPEPTRMDASPSI